MVFSLPLIANISRDGPSKSNFLRGNARKKVSDSQNVYLNAIILAKVSETLQYTVRLFI